MQKINTNVTCPQCHQSFRLSSADSTSFFRDMQIQIKCPICNEIANLSVMPKLKDKITPVSKNNFQVSKNRIGTPTFKPLIDSPPCSNTQIIPKLPFSLIKPEEKPSPTKNFAIKYIIALSVLSILCCIVLGIWSFNRNEKTVDNQVFEKRLAAPTSESQLYPETKNKH